MTPKRVLNAIRFSVNHLKQDSFILMWSMQALR